MKQIKWIKFDIQESIMYPHLLLIKKVNRTTNIPISYEVGNILHGYGYYIPIHELNLLPDETLSSV